jgi:hypothetical protein
MTQPILRVLFQETLVNGVPRAFRDTPTMRTHPTMAKRLLRGLTLAAFTVLGTMTCVANAGAATRIDSCRTLSTFGETYVLTRDLTNRTCDTSCLVVANNHITINLAGHTISGNEGDSLCEILGAGVTDGATPETNWQGSTVKNGTIKGFDIGVSLGSSASNIIRNLVVSDNLRHGLLLGPRSFVQGSTIVRNGQDGINIADFGQVRECVIGGPIPDGNGGSGINGGSRLVITHNRVVGNESGISVFDLSIVSSNTSSGNTFFGVLAGQRNLITGNTTNGNGPWNAISDLSSVSDNISNENGGVGVQASCPSIVTNNKSSGNSLMNYNIGTDSIGTGCQANNNK